MKLCTSSFPHRTFFFCIAIAAAALAYGTGDLRAQAPSKSDPFQKISFEIKSTCTVPTAGEVTALVKNGVELSVTEDFDCDGVADAYDNCVGMPNPEQADTDGNAIGDVCEAATTVRTGLPVKVKAERRRTKAHVKESSKKKARNRKERGRVKETSAAKAKTKKVGKIDLKSPSNNKRKRRR